MPGVMRYDDMIKFSTILAKVSRQPRPRRVSYTCQGAFQQAESIELPPRIGSVSEFLLGIIQIVKRGTFTPS